MVSQMIAVFIVVHHTDSYTDGRYYVHSVTQTLKRYNNWRKQS